MNEALSTTAAKHGLTIKIEHWAGFPIRFVGQGNDWKAIATDISNALAYTSADHMLRRIPQKYQVKKLVPRNGVSGQGRIFTLLTEPGIYKAVFGSHKPEAEQFQDWVYQVIQQLRKQAGLQCEDSIFNLSNHTGSYWRYQKQGWYPAVYASSLWYDYHWRGAPQHF